MEGLYLSHPCILVPYHKSWPLVVAQQEQAEFNAWFYRLRSYINDDHVKHLGCGLRMGCAVCVLSPVQLFHDSMDCSPPGASVPGITPTGILEWVAISSSIPDHQSSSNFFCHLKLHPLLSQTKYQKTEPTRVPNKFKRSSMGIKYLRMKYIPFTTFPCLRTEELLFL